LGASEWIYWHAYTANPVELLPQLHREVLDSGDYYWADESVQRPSSLAELHKIYSDEANEFLASEGTHSILDVFNVGLADAPDTYFTIKPLNHSEVIRLLGTDKPTHNQFEAVFEAHEAPGLFDFPRWSGRYTTIYSNGEPTEVVVWGYSGD
jgi:hypothetical protein